jgi:hypothetical protein
MLSSGVQQGLDEIFRKSVKTSISRTPETVCQIEVAPHAPQGTCQKFVLFTISSTCFKFLTFFHINEGKGFRKHFSKAVVGNSLSEERVDAGAFSLDTFIEFGNICCGAMNREFLKYFPNLGMSTPYVLEANSLEFMPALKPGYVRSFRISVDEDAEFFITLCMCNDHDLDFEIEVGPEEEVGALEFF